MMNLFSAFVAYQVSKTRTPTGQVTTDQLMEVRRLPYQVLGAVGGNPFGTIAAAREVSIEGRRFAVRTSPSYVDDRLAEPFQRDAQAGRQRAAEHFSLEKMVDATLAVYAEALGRPSV